MTSIQRNLIAFVAGFCLAMGCLVTAIGVHDHNQSEDLTVLWTCSLQGNKRCGPNEPIVRVVPDNIFYNWDAVATNWTR
jgi:hypothetical protein